MLGRIYGVLMITLAVALVGGFVFTGIVDYVSPSRPGSSSTFDLVAREISANTQTSPSNTHETDSSRPTLLNTFDFVLKCTNPNLQRETIKIFAKTGGESLFANFSGTDFQPSVSYLLKSRRATDLTYEFDRPFVYLNGENTFYGNYEFPPWVTDIVLDRRSLKLSRGTGSLRESYPCEKIPAGGDVSAEYEGLIAQGRSAAEARKQKEDEEKAAALRDRKL